MPDNIIHKYWMTTNRAEIITVVQPLEDFLQSLLEKLVLLKSHYYTAKVQTRFM